MNGPPNIVRSLKSVGDELFLRFLSKPQWTQGIALGTLTFYSKQRFQQALKYWSNFRLVLFDKGREIHSTNPCNDFNKSM